MINTNLEISLDDLLMKIERHIKVNSILSEYNLFWITFSQIQNVTHINLSLINFINDINSQPTKTIEQKLENNGFCYKDFILFIDDFFNSLNSSKKSVLKADFFVKTTFEFEPTIEKAVDYIKNISNCLSKSHYKVIKTSIENNSKYFLFSSD